jgi:predicted nucleic acid-binding protein
MQGSTELNTSIVLDTSVVIKWFRQGEVLAEEALALRDAYLYGQIEVALPTLLAYELANVLRYKADMNTKQVQTAVRSLFDMGLAWVLPSSEMMERAVEIARTHNTTVYNATFAALAESVGATFVTADERLIRRLEALPLVRFLGQVEDV